MAKTAARTNRKVQAILNNSPQHHFTWSEMSFTGSLSHIKLQFSQIDVDTLHIATAATLNSEQWTAYTWMAATAVCPIVTTVGL